MRTTPSPSAVARCAAAVAVLGLLTGGCTSAPDLAEVEPVATTEVAVLDNVFEPAVVAVEPGDTVTWTWEGDLQHNVVGEGAGVELFTELQVEGEYEATFPTEGVVAYRCTIHPAMVGEVRVGG